MAGDWIKMRVWLRRDPRVASMADFLAHERSFMDYVSEPHCRSCDDSAYECITSDITRAITVCALLEIWGVARERGDRDGDDLVLKHCTLGNLDDICSVPCIGEALEYVEWAAEGRTTDAKGRSIFYVRFPKFFAENEAPEERYKKQHAEAQARYRAKKAAESDKSVDAEGDITSDITVTPREEKSREEINTPQPPKGGDGSQVIPCPYAEVVKVYREELPTLPGISVMDDKRQRVIRKRWAWVLSSTKSDGTRRATNAAEALTWFREFFGRVRANAWLMGESPSKGHENWTADLDYLMSDRGLKAVIERTKVAA